VLFSQDDHLCGHKVLSYVVRCGTLSVYLQNNKPQFSCALFSINFLLHNISVVLLFRRINRHEFVPCLFDVLKRSHKSRAKKVETVDRNHNRSHGEH
jgi:hypothetical protein